MKKAVLGVGALVAVQLAAVLVYRAVEMWRARNAKPFVAEQLTSGTPAPVLDVEGGPARVPATGKVVLIHFWATWCPPCREELPGLLALGDELRGTGRFELFAVSVDEDWATVERYFAGNVPAGVVRARDGDAHRRYGVSTLPDSYLVDREGRLVERFGGARDWRSPTAIAYLRARLDSSPRR
jgi:thiol-disulfide isomerase/thioredoxin